MSSEESNMVDAILSVPRRAERTAPLLDWARAGGEIPPKFVARKATVDGHRYDAYCHFDDILAAWRFMLVYDGSMIANGEEHNLSTAQGRCLEALMVAIQLRER